MRKLITNHQLLITIIAALILAMSLTPRSFAFTIAGADIEAIALETVEKVLAERGETRRHEIFFTNRAPDLKLPEGVVEVKANIPTQISYLSLTPVRAVVYVNNRVVRTVSLTANIRVYDSVLVANHDLRIEIPVSAADFHTTEVAIDGRNEFVKDVAEIAGLVPHRFIRAGSPVTKSYFQQPVAVISGQHVNIILNVRGVKVSAKGIVITRGRVGSLVKVKNETSEKILTARVIDEHTVEVTM